MGLGVREHTASDTLIAQENKYFVQYDCTVFCSTIGW